ncbi:MAG: hypothetical protein HUU15_19315 [Candidatus Brocadiae bacterium]|nr:hypothetical protein [Candidatus Brocadiia bacterium]
MSGEKMSSAARACSLLLQTLGPRDRFGIVAFDDRTEWMGAAPRQRGSSEAWMLMQPRRGSASTAGGRMRP